MIASMTGFGRGSAEVNGTVAVVELRSVNNRFLEVSLRLPRVLADRETEVQTRLRQEFDRGRITVQVQLEESALEAPPIHVNARMASAYRTLLEGLREAAGIQDPVRLEHLLTFSEVFTAEEGARGEDGVWQCFEQALERAIVDLRTMRLEEGKALRRDLEARLTEIENELVDVEERAPLRIEEAHERLRHRLAELLGEERVVRERLELELVLYADKLDVTEECVRLRSHLELFRSALASDDSVGRRLNFLVQEMNREVNTIGSKANDAFVAHRAVAMKEELEKIREQVQNVE